MYADMTFMAEEYEAALGFLPYDIRSKCSLARPRTFKEIPQDFNSIFHFFLTFDASKIVT
jgi:hypothetical protein